jgi:hypothetical protein
MVFREMLDTSDPQQRAFSANQALSSYEKLVAQLRALGFLVPDMLGTIDQPDAAGAFFLKRDKFWTPEGARSTAEQVAHIIRADPFYQVLPKVVYRTRKLAPDEHQSSTSLAVQRGCQGTFEPEKVAQYRTAPEFRSIDFGEGVGRKRPMLVLAGSAYSTFAPANLEGFLAELTSLDVVNRSEAGTTIYAPLLSILTAPNFREAPPRYVVWEFPVEANLNLLSFMAFRQVLPALQGGCTARNSIWRETSQKVIEAGTFRVPGDREQLNRHRALQIAIGDRSTKTLSARVRYGSGETETIRLTGSSAGQGGSSYFITSLSSEISDRVTEVEVSGLPQRGTEVELQLCVAPAKRGA